MSTTTQRSEARNNEPYKITFKTIINALFNLICSSSFVIYFTYSYNLIPSNLKYRQLSKLLLAYVIIGWIVLIPKFLELCYAIIYYNQTTTLNIWNNYILPTKKPWLRLLQGLSEYGLIGIGCSFMSKFLPFSSSYHHCNIYEDYNYHICQSFRIISILTIIGLILWGLIIIVLLVVCLINKCNFSQLFQQQQQQQHPFYRNVFNTASHMTGISYLPIDYNPPSDKTCAICYECAEHELWKTLICQHKFHPHCIDPWLLQHHNCPICRCEQPFESATLPCVTVASI